MEILSQLEGSNFIVKAPKLKQSQDYALLRKEGLEHIEKLAHRLWTDYNIHDPGITILELLCYAITDLGYRTGYDIKDILTEDDRGVPVNRSNFHRALEVFTCNPVSFDDLRKLLIDIPGVRNAWAQKHSSVVYGLHETNHKLVDYSSTVPSVKANPPLNGLLDVFIEYDDFIQDGVSVGMSGISAEAGGFIKVANRGIVFDVEYPLTLKAVSVYPKTKGQVIVRLLDKTDKLLNETKVRISKPGEENEISLGFFIPPGNDYRLVAYSTTTQLYRNDNPAYPLYRIQGVIRLKSGIGGNRILQPYYFFYNWKVRYATPSSSPASGGSMVTRDDVRLAVKEKLHTHRNLCEDFVNICDLENEEIAVCADIEISPGTNVEEVLAEMFYRLDQHVSPRVRFYTIEELMDRGKTTDQIFEGPILEHGFIDDNEFQKIKLKCEIRTSDVIRIIMKMESEGIVAVKNISLLSFIDDQLRTQHDWLLELATDRFRAPEFSPDRSKIVFYRNDIPYFANRSEVNKLLKEKKARDIESKLKGHEKNLPIPVGKYRQLESYYPVQNELPATYRVGTIRVPKSGTPLRKAQAWQLKAYLMFFEQLLANYLSQLAHVRELFSWEGGCIRTYFTQQVTGITDIEDIYTNHFKLPAELNKLIEDENTAVKRKNRFLDHLIARFCEDFTDYSLLMYAIFKDGARSRLIEDKRILLAEYPLVSNRRSTAYDYRFPDNPDNISGYQRRLYRMLGIPGFQRRYLAEHRFFIEEVVEDNTSKWQFLLKDPSGAKIFFKSIPCESKSSIEVLLDFALGIGGDKENYRPRKGESGHELVHRCADDAKNESIGHTTSEDVLDRVVAYFRQFLEIPGLQRRHLAGHRFFIEGVVEDNTSKWQFLLKDPPEATIFESIFCESKSSIEVLLDFALGIGGDKENYQPRKGESGHELVHRCADDAQSETIGHTTSADALDQVVAYFRQYGNAEGFHIIEHILLRKRSQNDPYLPVQLNAPDQCDCVEVREPYSFRASIVLPSWPRRFRDLRFRRFVEKTLRLEAPAHIFLRICWISHTQMKEFEECYDKWANRLADLDDRLAGCATEDVEKVGRLRSGQLPLPVTGPEDQQYADALRTLISKLHSLVTVYPLARMYDCNQLDGDTPPFSLNNTSLGTF